MTFDRTESELIAEALDSLSELEQDCLEWSYGFNVNNKSRPMQSELLKKHGIGRGEYKVVLVNAVQKFKLKLQELNALPAEASST